MAGDGNETILNGQITSFMLISLDFYKKIKCKTSFDCNQKFTSDCAFPECR